MNREERLVANFQNVHQALLSACQRSGRDPKEITLLAVTKYAKDQDVLTLLQKGLIVHVGESRVQQAQARWEKPEFAHFHTVKHFIGHLQKNKAAKAAALFDFIDSLDNFDTALALEKHVPQGKTLRALVQVKLTDKETQSGLPLEEARRLASRLQTLQRVRVCGYMAIAPQGADEPRLRQLFRPLKQAFDEDFKSLSEKYLSLGMSADFETAVEEGSSLPRIGSRLFAENLEGL